MDAQILYATMTGHSRKIAKAIAKETGLPLFDLKEKPVLPPCGLLLVISGIYGGASKPELLRFAADLPPEQAGRVALITSSATRAVPADLIGAFEKAGHRVDKDSFLCRGSFLFLAWGHPDKGEIRGAAEFVKRKLAAG